MKSVFAFCGDLVPGIKGLKLEFEISIYTAAAVELRLAAHQGLLVPTFHSSYTTQAVVIHPLQRDGNFAIFENLLQRLEDLYLFSESLSYRGVVSSAKNLCYRWPLQYVR